MQAYGAAGRRTRHSRVKCWHSRQSEMARHAQIGSVGLPIVRDWILWFNAEGRSTAQRQVAMAVAIEVQPVDAIIPPYIRSTI